MASSMLSYGEEAIAKGRDVEDIFELDGVIIHLDSYGAISDYWYLLIVGDSDVAAVFFFIE